LSGFTLETLRKKVGTWGQRMLELVLKDKKTVNYYWLF